MPEETMRAPAISNVTSTQRQTQVRMSCDMGSVTPIPPLTPRRHADSLLAELLEVYQL